MCMRWADDDLHRNPIGVIFSPLRRHFFQHRISFLITFHHGTIWIKLRRSSYRDLGRDSRALHSDEDWVLRITNQFDGALSNIAHSSLSHRREFREKKNLLSALALELTHGGNMCASTCVASDFHYEGNESSVAELVTTVTANLIVFNGRIRLPFLSLIFLFLTYQHRELSRLQLVAQWICSDVNAKESFTLSRQVVCLIQGDGFWYVKLTCRQILNGCLWCDYFSRLMLRIYQVNKLLYRL